ncbi:hypothetical protein BC628DRAFT_1073153 [Trametes gibbosa]|nr:hypothetical protein BC628DRAFT_1073153 [Trametes gibbosa]
MSATWSTVVGLGLGLGKYDCKSLPSSPRTRTRTAAPPDLPVPDGQRATDKNANSKPKANRPRVRHLRPSLHTTRSHRRERPATASGHPDTRESPTIGADQSAFSENGRRHRVGVGRAHLLFSYLVRRPVPCLSDPAVAADPPVAWLLTRFIVRSGESKSRVLIAFRMSPPASATGAHPCVW